MLQLAQEVEWLLSFAHCNHNSTLITLFPLLPHPHLSSHFHRTPYPPAGLLFPVRAGGILIYKTTHFLQEIVFGQKSPTDTFLSRLLLLPLCYLPTYHVQTHAPQTHPHSHPLGTRLLGFATEAFLPADTRQGCPGADEGPVIDREEKTV